MATVLLIVCGALVALLLAVNLRSSEKKIVRPITHTYDPAQPQFSRVLGSLLGPAVIDGNQVTALHNGDEIFPAMLSAIRSARHSITFETYIYWSGEIGREFSAALAERAIAGVRVHLLLDWLGAGKLENDLIETMEQAGVEVEKFHPLRWYSLNRLNNRTHRKLVVIDGRIGFTGGVGIADLWRGHAQDPEHWRDTHYRIEGPAVAQMQAAFMDHWISTRGAVLHEETYFPALPVAGTHRAQVFRSGADDGAESVRLMYLLSLAAASSSLKIASAYFVPDDLTTAMLVTACRRGVVVEILVPGKHSDTALVRRASRARWGPLLEAGAAIFEYQPTMYHCKIMIVDRCWTSVGSTNFDNRSFRLNDEANLNVHDEAFALEQCRVFDADLTRARRITLAQWQGRPELEKIREQLAALLRSQL
ncbi:MAG: phospholipase D-like domain-containing protein [Gemmatimonadales bacterium]